MESRKMVWMNLSAKQKSSRRCREQMVTKREVRGGMNLEGGGMNWEIRIAIYTYIQCIYVPYIHTAGGFITSGATKEAQEYRSG